MFAFGSPEDQEEYEKKVEEAKQEFFMRVQQQRDDIKDMLNAMSVPHLVTLRKIMHTLSVNHEHQSAPFLEGQIAALLVHVHEVCAGCGKDHAQEGLDEILSEAGCLADDSEHNFNPGGHE